MDEEVRVWKIAPGEGAWQWDECVPNGFIGVGWDALGDVSALTREEFRARAEERSREADWGPQGAQQVWTFAHDIQLGDVVVANLGTRVVLGLGRVSGPYRFEEGVRYGHRRPVEWYDLRPRQVDQPGWLRTLAPLSSEQFQQINDAPLPPLAEPFSRIFSDWDDARWGFAWLRQALDLLGCHGPDDRRFALTLPSNHRGTVLRLNAGNWWALDLRGSGRVYANLLAEEADRSSALECVSDPFKQAAGAPELKMYGASRDVFRNPAPDLEATFRRSLEYIGGHMRGGVSPFWPAHLLDLFGALFEPPRLERLMAAGMKAGPPSRLPNEIAAEHVEQAMDEIDREGVPENRRSIKQVVVRGERAYPPKYVVSLAARIATGEELDWKAFTSVDATGFLKNLGYSPQRQAVGVNPPPIVPLDDDYQTPEFMALRQRVKESGLVIDHRDLRRYHLSLATRGFVILSGVSGSGKTWLTEVYAEAVGAVYLAVPVAPNWTTNEDLIGYHNPVDGVYCHTAFSRFLKDAAEAWTEAGMAGRPARPYHLVLDEMNLARVEHYFAKFLSTMEVRSRGGTALLELGPNEVVQLPPNLFFVGTVNVDETTHGFADKIYDRAQLLELHASRESLANHMSGWEFQQDVLAIWDAVRFVAPFAFRVLDEIRAYHDGAAALGVSWQEALDEQILQKVLPRLKGADPRVEQALVQVASHCEDRFPLTFRKVTEMLQAYRQHGFASYF